MLTLAAFVTKWQKSTLKEKAAAQEQFLDLCELLDQPKPAAADPHGATFTFEKGVTKSSGGDGFADVWKRGHFAWEYKGKLKDLVTAYDQLLRYSDSLDNPPLLVVSDMDRFEVHTRFTGLAKRVYRFDLVDLGRNKPTDQCPLPPLDVLHAVFYDPNRLRPTQTTAEVTEAAAAQFAKLAESFLRRGDDPERAALFLMRLLFCLFAEDVALLPAGLFARLVTNTKAAPAYFNSALHSLFAAMAKGGLFGSDTIRHFNGGLFEDDEVLDLAVEDLAVLEDAAAFDWSNIEPAIFGTLFERSLDPSKRSLLGAHYTSKADILLIVEPVLMAPLRRDWAALRAEADQLVQLRDAASTPSVRSRYHKTLERKLEAFRQRIASVRVLDPACGSGNFLYVALRELMDLEHEVNTFAEERGFDRPFHLVGPQQLHGIEINIYARHLAEVVIWIGYLQWRREHGLGLTSDPVLEPLTAIVQQDAILAKDERGHLSEPAWPDADIIIGNPPFLGGKRLRTELGNAYVNDLFKLYAGRVPREADLVCYWFERARELIEQGKTERAGLLATQAIRMGANRRVLTRIKQSGDMFMAWRDRPWVLDGAAVRVSMLGFDDGTDHQRLLDGQPVPIINANLTDGIDLTAARRLVENLGLAFMGDTKVGAFDIPDDVAKAMLAAPINPNGRPNSDVVRPWVNGYDLTHRPRHMWIIDFGVDMTEQAAALYEAPFEYVRAHVQPTRSRNARQTYRERWWIHAEPRPALRQALIGLPRFIATPYVSKHRLFVWLDESILPDKRLCVIVRADDYCFGVLHSRAHETWSLATSSRHGVGNDPTYNNTTCFETFAFPWPLGQEPADDPRVHALADAASELVAQRDGWLNPPGADEGGLKTRTLTNLYNERPTWLRMAHKKLDRAVFDAYGWPLDLSDEEILQRLLNLNLSRAAAAGAPEAGQVELDETDDRVSV